ncbi:hypothetical protein J6590_087564 [Homalodisca vitripennis]|nr:hypothetical protein J6590_087564 [Homalodisca vitripennis]
MVSIVDELSATPNETQGQLPIPGAGGDVLGPVHGLTLLPNRNNRLCALLLPCAETEDAQTEELREVEASSESEDSINMDD